MLVVGTNVGITLINVRTRELITSLSFNHVFQQPLSQQKSYQPFRHKNNRALDDKNDGIFGSMISQLIFGSDESQLNNMSRKHSLSSSRQKIIIMGQRTSDAKTFALCLNVQKNNHTLSQREPGVSSDTSTSHPRDNQVFAGKFLQQNSFSVVAQTPAKRGSLFENMQRKNDNMASSNEDGNPMAILHGKIKNHSHRRMKLSTSFPNLDEKDIHDEGAMSSEAPHVPENNVSTSRGLKPVVGNASQSRTKKTKSSGYGKMCEKIRMFEPNLNPSGKRRSSSTSHKERKKNVPGGGDNRYHNSYHNHAPALHRQQSQPSERESTQNYKGNESNDGNIIDRKTLFVFFQFFSLTVIV